MSLHDFPVGVRVKALRAFSGVPKGTEGVVDEHYVLADHEGATVAWDLPDQPLPEGYRVYDGRPAIQHGLLRDGFAVDELRFLEVI